MSYSKSSKTEKDLLKIQQEREKDVLKIQQERERTYSQEFASGKWRSAFVLAEPKVNGEEKGTRYRGVAYTSYRRQ